MKTSLKNSVNGVTRAAYKAMGLILFTLSCMHAHEKIPV